MTTTINMNDVLANPQAIVPKADETMAKALLDQYRQLGLEESKIQESRAAVRELIVKMFGESTGELVVKGKKVATLSKETRTFLNTNLIKKNFEFDKFPELYTQSTVTVLRLTRQSEVQ